MVLWAAATSKAQAILASASPDDRVAVLTFDRQINRLVSFEEWASLSPANRGAEALSRIEALKPGGRPLNSASALTAAAETIMDSDKQGKIGGTRRIVVISDLQEGSRPGRTARLRLAAWHRGGGREREIQTSDQRGTAMGDRCRDCPGRRHGSTSPRQQFRRRQARNSSRSTGLALGAGP